MASTVWTAAIRSRHCPAKYSSPPCHTWARWVPRCAQRWPRCSAPTGSAVAGGALAPAHHSGNLQPGRHLPPTAVYKGIILQSLKKLQNSSRIKYIVLSLCLSWREESSSNLVKPITLYQNELGKLFMEYLPWESGSAWQTVFLLLLLICFPGWSVAVQWYCNEEKMLTGHVLLLLAVLLFYI